MLRRLTLPILVAVSLLVAACTQTQPPAPGKPAISSRTPAAGAANVAVDAVVTVTFDKAIKAASLNGNLTLAAAGAAVDGAVTYDAATRTATFTAAAALANATTYTATVRAGVESSQGVKLGADASWDFTTVAAAQPAVRSVTIENGDATVLVGETVDLAAEVVAVNGADESVTWASDDEAVATVDADGVVTGVAAGTANVTATSVFDATVSDSIVVTVAPLPAVLGIAIDQAAPAVAIGGTTTLTVTVDAVGGANEAVTWESDDDATLTVDADGEVTGVVAGTATVTVTSVADPSITDSVVVTVAPPLAFDADYPDVAQAASVLDYISVSAPAPSSPGYGDIVYEVTSGGLPGEFVALESGEFAAAYTLELDPDTGAISGSTGYPGLYTGTVTATDELGQTATLDFSFDLALAFEVYDSAGTAPQTEFTFTDQTETVVPGDRIRVSGVANTLWLPRDFADELEFGLTYLETSPPRPGEDGAGAFLVNESEGTVTLGSASTGYTWTYILWSDYRGYSAGVLLHFVGEPAIP